LLYCVKFCRTGIEIQALYTQDNRDNYLAITTFGYTIKYFMTFFYNNCS